jgi:hypothetical protein
MDPNQKPLPLIENYVGEELQCQGITREHFRPFDFTDAMRLIDEGWNEWAAKDHNTKWSRRIEGTPIRNDLTCSIARAIIEANRIEK